MESSINQNFHIDFPPEKLHSCKVLIMRHATSEVNEMIKQDKNIKNDRARYLDKVLDPSKKDPPLCEQGFKEAQSASNLLKQLSIKKIVCSPMTRAIMTALHVGLEDSVRIELWPELRERMSFKNTYCKQPGTLSKEFPEPVLDFSQLDSFWFIKCLQNPTRANLMIEACLEAASNANLNEHDSQLSQLEEINHKALADWSKSYHEETNHENGYLRDSDNESPEELEQRVDSFTNKIIQESQKLGQNERILVITHSANIKQMLGKDSFYQGNKIKIENAQILPYFGGL